MFSQACWHGSVIPVLAGYRKVRSLGSSTYTEVSLSYMRPCLKKKGWCGDRVVKSVIISVLPRLNGEWRASLTVWHKYSLRMDPMEPACDPSYLGLREVDHSFKACLNYRVESLSGILVRACLKTESEKRVWVSHKVV